MRRDKFKIQDNKRICIILAICIFDTFGLLVCNKLFTDMMMHFLRYFIICSLLGTGLGYCVAFRFKLVYMQIFEDHFEVTTGNDMVKYDFEEFVEADAQVDSKTAGTFSTKRYILVKKANSSMVWIGANCISRAEFEELVSFLEMKKRENQENPVPVEEQTIMPSIFTDKESFFIPGDDICFAIRIRFILYVVLGALCVVTGSTLLVWGTQFGIETIVQGIYGAVLVVVAIQFFVSLIVPWSERFGAIKSIPAKITIDDHAIVVDGRIYSANGIKSISMLPAANKSMPRNLIFTTKEGINETYNFGELGATTDKYTFKDYEEIFEAVAKWCDVKNIMFISIPG